MDMLPKETVVASAPDDSLVLTTHRVRYETKRTGVARFTSMMLEEVSCCTIARREKPMLLALAVFLGAAGVVGAARGAEVLAVLIVAAVALLAAYFLTRHQTLSIVSTSGIEIAVHTSTDLKRWKTFIDRVELAKDARFRGVTIRGLFAPDT
ncbi:hypothetical protein ACFL6C_01165 [Myxococcota bacterium]